MWICFFPSYSLSLLGDLVQPGVSVDSHLVLLPSFPLFLQEIDMGFYLGLSSHYQHQGDLGRDSFPNWKARFLLM